jgi:1-aminocyclopropane-1-carboxylate deaminase/D-cysteine desulfhydrase-like pyridoxal-dependent ACC family enzyme
MNDKRQTVNAKRINETTPVQRVRSQVADAAGVRWLVKRDDLIHPQISGNKWRKLKYNLAAARQGGFDTLVTFGGAFSNHLYAVAAAGRLFGFKTVGIVRGERAANLSPTLQFAESCGMELVFWSREAYRSKENAPDFADITNRYAPFYLIPEGGTNEMAVRGCAEIVGEIAEPFDYLTCACGTGGTLAGLIAGCDGRGQVIGFSALKGGEFLVTEVGKLLENHYAATSQTKSSPKNWHIRTEYHFGGYARHTPALLDFMRRFEQENGFLIEQVYTAKMFYGTEELMRQGGFRRGETVISLHTGGLQGRGFNSEL